ncbi:lysophospholipid acyltransferase family protein [Telmatospirillum siberiense]|uniref:1-acyl-sn-glycerol-3-phosphate acyltransferase n=1 Tax=Telmatospirillum siberiense TaxID=382514 RepID=A0A2N3PW27_9PROT|nr:lysophospholipid acyltransferase family protein [Telmatospirillum siberiense]PKU24588.1 1-acyl-sn-glycerol-3-phosphate acyltransferase [Telmatospirillum siberiense]
MMRRLDYSWRLFATGSAFAFIFFGGGLLAVTVLPLLSLLPGRKRRRAQMIVHRLFRHYIWMLRHLGLLTLQTEGLDKLAAPGGRLVVANHPSLLDVVILMAFIPKAQCIVKHQLWDHKLLGPLVRRAGYIRNDLDPETLVAACKTALDQGNSLIIFPEGTRSLPGVPPQMRRGFANLATLTGASIQLVVITCDPPTLIKGEPWWRIPPHKPSFRLVVDEVLDASTYLDHQCRSLAARHLVRFVETYFAEKLGYV